MNKTLLLGAGARLFVNNEQHKRDFIAFIDNDSRKCGTDFTRIRVMAPVDAIAPSVKTILNLFMVIGAPLSKI